MNRSRFIICALIIVQIKGLASTAYDEHHHTQRRCEEIKVPMCKKVGYNMTAMPNQFNHINQVEAESEANQFEPLLKTNCSPDLLFFLCSVYTPICIPDYHQSLPPCKTVCERVRSGCEPLMKRHGFAWPQNLNCNRVTGQSEQLCMDSNPKVTATTSTSVTITRRSGHGGRTRERSSPANLQKHEQFNYVSPITDAGNFSCCLFYKCGFSIIVIFVGAILCAIQ